MLIDDDTDNLVLVNFEMAVKLGWELDPAHRNVMGCEEVCLDVKLTVFAVYELITQDSSLRKNNLTTPEDLNMAQVLGLDDWELHPDILLEEGVPVSKYRQMLEEWVKARQCMNGELRNGKEAPESIDWPDVPGDPLAVDPTRAGKWWRGELQRQSFLTQHNLPFLQWQCPATRRLPLPSGQRLLATGTIPSEAVPCKL
ncbi:hypothetical protein B0J18DRAFT_61834 [Chaetomium sp. MPI-SDFR-AT-0129]|nr:hypothetical protein B0J18DRAFT_61834 [Chaetomium sp. MPI-SDFR-AT-0129]